MVKLKSKNVKLYHCKNLILLWHVDIDKHFIGYKDNDYKIKLLRKMRPKTIAYVKRYDGETKWMNFLIKDDDLLKKYNDIWNKVCNNI